MTFTPKLYEYGLGMLAHGVVSDRNNAHPFFTKCPDNLLEVFGICNELSVGDCSIVRAGDRDPGAHAHLSADLLAAQECPRSDRRAISAIDHTAFHRENSVERSWV